MTQEKGNPVHQTEPKLQVKSGGLSGDQTASAMLAGYFGKSGVMEEEIACFAASHAEQTERDHKALTTAARQGRIPVATEF